MEKRIKIEMSTLINNLQHLQFAIVRNRYDVEQMSSLDFDETYNIQNLQ